MSYFGQVLEDPEYYDEGDQVWDDTLDDDDEFEDPTDFVSVMEHYNPFNTVNS
jgi:hypothetical protein